MSGSPQNTAIIPIAFLTVALLFIFSIDLFLPLGVAFEYLYLPAGIYGMWYISPRKSLLLPTIISALLLLGFLFAPIGSANDIELVNRAIVIVAIWMVSAMVVARPHSNARLADSEERRRLIFDNAPIGMATVDVQGKWLEVNSALCKIVGYSKDELLATDFQAITHSDDLDADMALLERLYQKDIKFYEIEKRYIHKEGHAVWVSLTVGAKRNGFGLPQFYIAQIVDINERKKAADENATAEAFKDLVTNTIPDLVFVKDSELRIVQANNAFINLYPEEKRDKIIGYTTFEDYDPAEAELFSQNDRVALEKGIHETEELIQFPNGAVRTLFTKKLRFEDNGSYYLLGVARDITALKKVQKKLELANQELEKFSYIASHDLKAPLRGIDNLAQWIEEDLEATMTEETKSRMVLLRSRVKRLENMLRDILEYSRAGHIVETPQEIDLNELLPGIIDGLALSESFTLSVPRDFPSIFSPLTPLEQIFSNLLTNSVKHHDQAAGKIDISWKQLGDYIEFAVKDDGPGIPEEHHERVFTMFQTLKSRDVTEGSGLGMSIIEKLVEQQGGAVRIESEKSERGTTVVFTWPKYYQKIEEGDHV